jgi:hypothetical protein
VHALNELVGFEEQLETAGRLENCTIVSDAQRDAASAAAVPRGVGHFADTLD